MGNPSCLLSSQERAILSKYVALFGQCSIIGFQDLPVSLCLSACMSVPPPPHLLSLSSPLILPPSLPPPPSCQYHDMGLIGSVLGTLYCGGSGYYLSPLDFVRSPPTWITAVDRFRATHLQAPNFAFALTARKWQDLKTKVNGGRVLSDVITLSSPLTMVHFTVHRRRSERFYRWQGHAALVRTLLASAACFRGDFTQPPPVPFRLKGVGGRVPVSLATGGWGCRWLRQFVNRVYETVDGGVADIGDAVS